MTLIERDFAAHNTTSWKPGSVSRSRVCSPLDSEADIIASPSTGIVITTLQKIKQKPLPGQAGISAIRERIEGISVRYEKLIVLVSEGREDEIAMGMDDKDCHSFTEFLGFCSGFETNILVQFVGGGRVMLTRWLASAITQHAVGEELEILPEETHWELFLRRAGLNAFAAQVIIAELKAPEGVNHRSASKAGMFGLTGFVELGRQQIIDKFGPICGTKLMARVSALIDRGWEV